MATVMDTEGYPPYETVLQVLEKLCEVTRKEVDKLLDACKNKHKVTAQSDQTFGGKPSTGAFGTNTSTHQGNPFENAKSVVNRDPASITQVSRALDPPVHPNRESANTVLLSKSSEPRQASTGACTSGHGAILRPRGGICLHWFGLSEV